MPARRAFTLVVCIGCRGRPDDALLDRLRAVVRSFPHGMLVSTACLLGSDYCATRPGAGVIAMLQPCMPDRTPVGHPRWIGPITDESDLADVCDWILQGEWGLTTLPVRLQNPLTQLGYASRQN